MVLLILLVEILAINIKSIHLLDPLTSIPINGTKIKNIKKKKTKIIEERLKSFFDQLMIWQNIMIVPNKIKIKCLKKNE